MAQISVERIKEGAFRVTVTDARTTVHEVTVSPADHLRFTDGRCSPEDLVERSFEFLLEREPNTAILQRFDLPVISRYFPEYEQEIKKLIS